MRKIEIVYTHAFCQAVRAGGARVCGVMTAPGVNPESGMNYPKIIGEKEAAESVSPQERPRARDGSAVGAGVTRDRAGQRSPEADREDSGVQDMKPFFVKGDSDEP